MKNATWIYNTSTIDSPLDIQTIHKNQQDDTELLARKDKHSEYILKRKLEISK